MSADGSLRRDHRVDGVLHQRPAHNRENQLENQIENCLILGGHPALHIGLVELFAHFVSPVDAVNAAGDHCKEKGEDTGGGIRSIGKFVGIIGQSDEPIEGVIIDEETKMELKSVTSI